MKKCSVQYFLNCSYRLGRLKRQQTSDKLRFLHRSYTRAKQNGRLLLREKQARQLSTCLSKPLTAKHCSHRLTIEPWNHGTKNLKWIKNMVCCRLTPGSNKWKVEAEENTQFLFRRKVKRSSNKFALEKVVIVSFVAGSSEEQLSEWNFLRI